METVTLAGAVIVIDGQLLVLHRAPKNWYELPGGKVEPGETEEAAVVRELQEELTVTVTIIKKLGTQEFDQDNRHFIYHWYQAKLPENAELIIPKQEQFMHDHYRWLPLEKLIDYPKSGNLENFQNAYQKGELHLI